MLTQGGGKVARKKKFDSRSFLFDGVSNKPREGRPLGRALLNFSSRIFTGGAKRSSAPHLLPPLRFGGSAFFLLPFARDESKALRLLFLPVTNPSSLARRLISASCIPRRRQRRIIMHVLGTLSAFKQPSPSSDSNNNNRV